MIIMKHPDTGGVIRVPDRSQSIYERSGWKLDEAGTKALQDEPGAAQEAAGPVTDKEQARLAALSTNTTKDEDSGDAGSRSGSRQASKSKEEGK